MKILIVGAGPVGCYTAQLLRRLCPDSDIEIIEEHAEIGRPVHCAGLISRQVLSEMKVALRDECVMNRIDAAAFFLNGDIFQIRRSGVAVVIDRERFDRALGEGLAVNFQARFVGIEREGSGYLVETDRGEHYADIVIGADGALSALRSAAGFEQNLQYLRGVQFRIKHSKPDRHTVGVYLKNQFFAWMIPESEQIVRVGIISDNPYHELSIFLKEAQLTGEVLEKFAGVVPLGICQTQKDNLALVGDAACQVKPLTHGGIYYGMRCAEILVDCIANKALQEYEREWKKRFARELYTGLKLKQMYEKLSRQDIEKIFAVLKENVSLIENFADFENHSKVISLLVKNPRLQMLLGRVLISMF